MVKLICCYHFSSFFIDDLIQWSLPLLIWTIKTLIIIRWIANTCRCSAQKKIYPYQSFLLRKFAWMLDLKIANVIRIETSSRKYNESVLFYFNMIVFWVIITTRCIVLVTYSLPQIQLNERNCDILAIMLTWKFNRSWPSEAPFAVCTAVGCQSTCWISS